MRTQETPLILLVGHCTPDAWMLRTAVGRADEDAEIDVVNDESQLRGHVQEPDRPVVALINRKLDGRFDAEDGLSLMATFGAGSSVPVLVSGIREAGDPRRRHHGIHSVRHRRRGRAASIVERDVALSRGRDHEGG